MKVDKHVFLVEDNDGLREDLTHLLEYAGYTVHAFSDPIQFLSHDKQFTPAVIVSDMQMPHMTGLELQQKLIDQGSKISMVIISGESKDQQIISSLKNGAIDFLLKPFLRESLLVAIEKGIALHLICAQKDIQKNRFEAKLKVLSPRERQVFNLLAEGYSNMEIVQNLNISLPTAKQYKSSVMIKLELKSLTQLIALKKSGI